VAIVTTAALRRPGDPTFPRGDESFRVLPAAARDLTVGHASPNWDRSGLAADLNVAYPIDRLHELAADGVVGEDSFDEAQGLRAAYERTRQANGRTMVGRIVDADRVPEAVGARQAEGGACPESSSSRGSAAKAAPKERSRSSESRLGGAARRAKDALISR
jgi:hypothetical protein